MSRSRKESASSVPEMTTAFLSVLDNEEVISKLAMALSASINLIFEEKLMPLVKKIDALTSDFKSVKTQLSSVAGENEKLSRTTADLELRVNLLEQALRKCNIVISGVPETYAERVVDAADDNSGSATITRDDTIKSVCDVLKVTCNVQVSPSDIQSAARLQSKRPGSRPLLVSFYSAALRSAVCNARRPKQTLMYNGTQIYISDHLTKYFSDLSYQTRLLVKQKNAHSTWVRNGQIFIKWSVHDKPSQVRSMSDLS